MSDFRTGKRFPLHLPVIIHSKQDAKKVTATSSDLSAAGVYIWADTAFEVGTPIKFDITLPGQVIGTTKDVEIECTGRVIRAAETNNARKNSRSGKRGVACVIDQYRFIRR